MKKGFLIEYLLWIRSHGPQYIFVMPRIMIYHMKLPFKVLSFDGRNRAREKEEREWGDECGWEVDEREFIRMKV